MGMPINPRDMGEQYSEKYREAYGPFDEPQNLPRQGPTKASYLEVAQSREVIVQDVAAAAAMAWTQVMATEVPAELIEAILDSSTVANAQEVLSDALAEEIDDEPQRVAVAAKIDELAATRAQLRPEVLAELEERDSIIPSSLVPSRPQFSVDDVEKALNERMGAVEEGSVADQVLQQIAESAPGELETPHYELPFIGGLPASQAWAYDEETQTRVPVDPNTGTPLSPGQQGAFFQPQGIYTGDDPTNAGRIARGEKIVTPERYIEGGTIPPQTNAPYFPTGDPYLMRNVEHIQRYHIGFNWEPASWDPTEVAKIKDQLVEANLLDPDDRSRGAQWSVAEADAFAVVAEVANKTGEMWGFVLGGMAANPPAGTDGRSRASQRVPFVAPAYLAPDMDVLKQAVKDSVRGRLGREPTGREMEELIVGLDQDYRSAYDVQVAAARSEYDATTAAIETEQPQSGGEFRNVDPSASFAERFEERFANSLDFMKRRESLNERQQYTDATVRMIDNLIGSG